MVSGETIEDDPACELAVGQEWVLDLRFEVGPPQRLARFIIKPDRAGGALAAGASTTCFGDSVLVGHC